MESGLRPSIKHESIKMEYHNKIIKIIISKIIKKLIIIFIIKFLIFFKFFQILLNFKNDFKISINKIVFFNIKYKSKRIKYN